MTTHVILLYILLSFFWKEKYELLYKFMYDISQWNVKDTKLPDTAI